GDGVVPRGEAGFAWGWPTAWPAIRQGRWQGQIAVLEEGPYWLDAVAPGGRASLRYRVTPLPDAPPVLAVRVPSGDVDLPTGQKVPLEVWGTDDLGLTELRLAYRKGEGPWVRVPLQRLEGQPREMPFPGAGDAQPPGLVPG